MPYKPPPPDLHPSIQKVRAVVTTRWKGKGYRPLVISSLEQYYIDTALDNDADTWSVDIGDPNGQYLDLLDRDNEVRVQLFGVGHEGLSHMLTGIADEIDYQDGSWNLTGRDLSSLATDSTVLPHRWSKARAWAIVKRQAHNLGFHNTNLSRTGIVKKVQYADGSESYWDFWYRLYRQEKMWLWTLPDGTLVGGKLDYGDDPIYFFGDTLKSDGDHIKSNLIPITANVLTKTTQSRVWEVVVYGSRGGNKYAKQETGFNVVVHDPTMHPWKKRPRKVLLDTKSRTPSAARREGWEEIFEGKVGSVEYKVTIPDPGFVVQQNKIARVVVDEIGLKHEMFVVGSRIQGDSNGFIQEVRLRERGMAVSARVPTAPKLNTGDPSSGTQSSLGAQLEQAGMPQHWGDYFVKAAKKWHQSMDYSLFLACLMGICKAETGFQNERENGGPGGDHIIWHPFVSSTPDKPQPGQSSGSTGNSRSDWERQFANEPGVYGITRQYGVGPMQLTSIGLKRDADDLMGHRNQYGGGRWHPEHNIMIAAMSLHIAIRDLHATRDSDIWIAVDAYNRGVAGARSYFNAHKSVSPYAQEVRKYVMSDPGYLAQVQAAIQASQQKDSKEPVSYTDAKFTNPFPNGWTPTRLDQGWDGTIKQKIVAPFDGTIMFAGALSGWGSGNHGVVIKASSKIGTPWGTDALYFYEGLAPTVKTGDKVQAGQRIARPARNGFNNVIGNIEFGPAALSGRGVQAAPLVQQIRGDRRKMVIDFYHWSKKTLHVPGEATSTDKAGLA